jgi:ABC-type multidrug transport system ATPase subunit
MIELQGVTKRYGDFTAVEGLDLTVQSGEVFGFLGANGAGKTTTLKMLAGILRADAAYALLASTCERARSKRNAISRSCRTAPTSMTN